MKNQPDHIKRTDSSKKFAQRLLAVSIAISIGLLLVSIAQASKEITAWILEI